MNIPAELVSYPYRLIGSTVPSAFSPTGYKEQALYVYALELAKAA